MKSFRTILGEMLEPSVSECPNLERLESWLRGDLTPEEVRCLQDHLLGCPSCMERWRDLRLLLGDERALQEVRESSGRGFAFPAPGRRSRKSSYAYLWAFALVVLMVVNAWMFLQWYPARPSGLRAWRSPVEPSRPGESRPVLVAVVDVYPQDEVLRGGGEPANPTLVPPDRPVFLFLNPAVRLPEIVELRLHAGGRLVWRKTVKASKLRNAGLFLPGGRFVPRTYELTVRSPEGKILQRFLFEVRK